MKYTKIVSKIFNYFKLLHNRRHRWKVKKSRALLQTIKNISSQENGSARALGYLRKIDPYLFEELILTVFEESNIRVYRNKSYSGDGGLDGIVKISGKKYCIQCKRYQHHINKKDVEKLILDARLGGFSGGLFFHTGKTGPGSKELFKDNLNGVRFISGSSLIGFISSGGTSDALAYLKL